jgi:hypothetical protein
VQRLSALALGGPLTTANRLLVAMGGTSAVVGVLEPHVSQVGAPLSPLAIGYTLTMAVLLFTWCKADAAKRGIVAPVAAPILVALLAIVGVPYYFFKTLPFDRALRATGKALIFFLLLIVLQGFCSFASARLAQLGV